MASSSEIEKLERRCAENPHGLTFAPLAEAYRKHGDTDRALDVLRTGRELHPDYIPASIVLGRCHLDRGDLPEAERAFAHVLTLDPENVIALKALADLAEREGRSVQAERWLNLLLAVDPSNEDAQAQLDRIRSGATAELGGPAVLASGVDEAAIEPVAEPEPEVASEPVAVVEPEPASVAEAEAGAELKPEAEPVSLAEPEPEPEPELEPGPEPALPPHAEQPLPLAMVGGADDDEPDEGHAVMSAGGTEEAPVSAEAVVVDITVEREEEIVLTPVPTSDYRGEVAGALPEVNDAEGTDELSDPFAEVPDSPDAADDLPDVFDTPRYASYEETEPSDAAASHLEPMPDLMAEFGEAEAFEEHAEPSEPETLFAGGGAGPTPVVTESMAELYLRQGHRAEALEIYRQLAARRPDDARLASVVSGLAAEVDVPPASAPAYAAAQTGGRSVGDLLRGILAERLAAAPPAPEPFPESPDVPEFRSRDEVLADAEDQGEPTRPADDHLTLGAVFGDEDGGAPPAVASPESPSHEQNGGLSFDEFFGAPPAVEPDATRTAPPAPTGDPDDLDQFHAWLQSLKR